MSKRCPEGHLSETEDWCDECGARIAPAVAAEEAKADAAVELAGSRAGVDEPSASGGGLPAGGSSCPVCSTARVGDDRYCEVCGYDYVTGTGPVPVAAVPLRPPGPPVPPGPVPLPPPPAPKLLAPSSPVSSSPVSLPPKPASPVRAPSGWSAEVVADRAFYDRGADEDDVPFPTTVVTRVVELGGTRSLIGRQSRSRGYFPEIDLSAVPEDRGVSRTHAMLDHPADGSLSITDLGSSNGTWLDDAQRPLERGVAVELRDGSRIYLGSWTRITLRRR